jgi:hypothetical protein
VQPEAFLGEQPDVVVDREGPREPGSGVGHELGLGLEGSEDNPDEGQQKRGDDEDDGRIRGDQPES